MRIRETICKQAVSDAKGKKMKEEGRLMEEKEEGDMDFSAERHVVLVAPEVHWNTGNIGRTCLGAGAHLHLVKPLGFSLGSREVKRAGLDYWHRVRLSVWEDFGTFLEALQPGAGEMALFTKNAKASFWEMPSPDRLFLVFGSETRGLPEELLSRYRDHTYHIPISREIRCLNLSTAAGIALYESSRRANPANAWTDSTD